MPIATTNRTSTGTSDADSTATAISVPSQAAAPSSPIQPRVKPRLRGVSHEVAAFVAAPAAALLVMRAQRGRAAFGAAVYGATLFTLFAVSAFYHRPFWRPRPRDLIGRIDHSAIFLLVAGTYTPLGLLLGPGAGQAVLLTVWIGAALGVGLALAWGNPPKPLMAGIYVLLGWVIVPVIPRLHAAIGTGGLLLLLGGGFAYTVGAVVYATRRPDPYPAVFGFHEVFHLLVIAAAACHFVVVEAALRAMASSP